MAQRISGLITGLDLESLGSVITSEYHADKLIHFTP
jgi:hypothetical protein